MDTYKYTILLYYYYRKVEEIINFDQNLITQFVWVIKNNFLVIMISSNKNNHVTVLSHHQSVSTVWYIMVNSRIPRF